MKNRSKIMILITLFWIVFETILLLIGFPSIPVLIFVTTGTVIFYLIGMLLDLHNEKANRWFDSTKFFKK